MKLLAKQRGVTFGGFIMVLALLGGLAIFSMKLIPAYMENGKIQKAFDAITHDPAMQTATMDNVTTVTSNDIEINKDGGRLKLSASYSTKIPLAGNVSLLIEFNPSAPK
jgi:hypothetical protein